MILPGKLAKWFRPAVFLGSNPITLAGAVLTTSSAATLIGFWIFVLIGGGAVDPYAGVIFFLILPGVFVFGLVLMPTGALLRRRALKRAGELPEIFPQIDFSKPVLRSAVAWVGGLTLLNVVIFSTATYHGVEYMDSAQFCGQTCHTVMQPEYTAYSNSPHQRVACVECHIGPGAGWFARSKLSGVRQVLAVTFHTYDRPIPSPVEQLRPARETCEQCHWPQRFTGDKMIVAITYLRTTRRTPAPYHRSLDEDRRPDVAGRRRNSRAAPRPSRSRIQYISTDRDRQNIVRRELRRRFRQAGGVYQSRFQARLPSRSPPANIAPWIAWIATTAPLTSSNCPSAAVDQAMSDGQISADLPFIKKEVSGGRCTPTIRTATPQRRGSLQLSSRFTGRPIPTYIADKRSLVDAAVTQVQAIYLRNIFPADESHLGDLPNNLGHTDSPGCFRCHDGSHTSADGRTIPNGLRHVPLAAGGG